MIWSALTTILLLACPLLQSTLLYRAAPGDVTPNLLLLVVCLVGLARGPAAGSGAGFLGGFLLGALCGNLGAPMAISYVACGWAAGLLRQRGWTQQPLVFLCLAAALGAFNLGLQAVILGVLGAASHLTMDWQTASLIVLYHTMLLVPVFWLLRLTLWHPAAHARRLRVTVVHRPFG